VAEGEQESGRFTARAMTSVMQKVAAELKLDAAGATLLRLTNNAVFALPRCGIVIRIGRSARLHERAEKVAKLGVWFEEVNAPAIRLASGIPQPLMVNGLSVTLWDYVKPTASVLSVEDLGTTLQEFHGLGIPPFDLPRWDPVADARRRIADAEGLGGEDRNALEEWCERLEPKVAEMRTMAPDSLIHGDAHVGNLLRSGSGRVLLCDFDATCLGPRVVDLASVAVGELRFGRNGVHQRMVDSYGLDVMADPSWEVLRDARELKMVVAAVPLLLSTSGITEEFQIRLHSALRRDYSVRWTPFADIADAVAR
jgi:hypothetical protein